MRTIRSICFAFLITSTPGYAATIRVPTDQPTIQAGINAANSGDSVLVASGTYTGAGNKNLNPMGKGIVIRSELGPDSTTIDCEEKGRGLFFQTGEDSTTVVEGFTIRNGQVGGGFPDSWGGGLLCIDSSPRIVACKIISNSASGRGGGVACFDASPRLEQCLISQNSAADGGGLNCHSNGAPILTECSIIQNTAVASLNPDPAFLSGNLQERS